MKLKVRLHFIDEPPDPRNEDDVILYEAIQEMQRLYNNLKDSEDMEDQQGNSQ